MAACQAASEVHTASESPLLKLPAELRNYIYTLAIVENKPIRLEFSILSKPHPLEPTMLAVNWQVRRESLPIFYGRNIFSAANSLDTTTFLRHISADKLKMLRGVQAFTEFKLARSLDVGKQLQCVGKRVDEWQKEHGARGLRVDAILVPLPVIRADGVEFEWVAAPRVKDWVTAPRVNGWVTWEMDSRVHFVRREESAVAQSEE
ncbi:hypothetical protein LTR36_004246 [Oleoguttula mirabilis]|uniref:Uncharacterized protein n=1 Tax=Oleoguttula mirabilis TaxID=1507867 RepID=A0AAV9JG89_9PEZI|nr:hypothetical protein LTR36_004246 [Oleoguttula mirabilis]